jgi:hypothetical protein
MSTRSIVNGFALVVAVLVGLGVWGWYASDDSRAEVERIREARRLEVFCQEYRGVDDLERIYGPAIIPETTLSVPYDPAGPDPGALPPTSWDYEPVEMVDLERLARNAPTAIEDEVDQVADAGQQLRETGNPQAFVDPEVQQSVQRITEYGATNCR